MPFDPRQFLASAPAALAASGLFTCAVGIFFWKVWNADAASLIYNVPIAMPFAAFFFDRIFPRLTPRAAASGIDALVIGLALLRVFAPPLPFVSGHTLFATYACHSARRWPLRITALAVLAQVIYIKLFVAGGWVSMMGGLLVGAVAALVRQRLSVPAAAPPLRS